MASEMITELFVPRDRLVEFMERAASFLRKAEVPVIYGTVRFIKQDTESFLAWAREDYACIIFNLHTEHHGRGIEQSASAFRGLIDIALQLGGSYYLTYHRWASREQVERAYPNFNEFLLLKEKYDTRQLFQSDWWRHYREIFSKS